MLFKILGGIMVVCGAMAAICNENLQHSNKLMPMLLFVLTNFAVGVFFYSIGWMQIFNLTAVEDVTTPENILYIVVTIVTMLTVSFLLVKLYLKTFMFGSVLCTSLIGLVSTIMLLVFTNKILHKMGISEHKDVFGPIASTIIIVVGVGIAAFLGYKLANTFIFIGVAFFCSYTFVRGISLLLGGFVNEASLMIGVFTDKDMPELTIKFGLYILAILICWIMLLARQLEKLGIKRTVTDHQVFVDEERKKSGD